MIDTFAIRCSILRLAFSGKLTDQISTDGTAADILARINSKKDIRQNESLPYPIPDSWAWAKLADLYKINPKVEADGGTDAAFIPMERISGGFCKDFTFETQKWEQAAKNHTKFEDNDVAFAKITPCFENRKSFIAHGLPNGIGGGTTELIILRQKEMLPEYTYYLLLDQRFINAGTASYKGTVGQQRVQSDVIKNYLIPVAPYAEQQRIVDKIEQVFSVLNTIDALQTSYSENLTALKSKLIDAAIQGKLTEQLSEDGTAEELYQQILIEKQELINQGIINKEKPLPEIKRDILPFSIPSNWKWIRWGELSYQIQYGYNAPAKESGRIKMVRITDIQGNKVNWTTVPYCDIDEESIESYRLHSNDILFARTGATVGKSYLVESVEEDAVFAGYLIRTSYSPRLSAKYMKFFMESDFYWKQLRDGTTATAQPNCNAKTLSKMLVPLPPIAEQLRIVEKLDETLKVINT